MDMGFNYRDLDGCRILPFFLGETWPRSRWNMNVVNLMEFRRSLDESEMEIYGPGWKLEMELGWSRDLNVDETGAVWIWLAHLQTLMCLIRRLDESVDIFKTWMEVRRSMDWYGMQLYVHVLTWDTICMERACEYWSLDWDETIIPRPGWEMGPGLIWDTPPETCLW